MIVSIIFYLVALGLAALGSRYLLASEPLDYHAAILRQGETEISPHTAYVVWAIYKVVGSFMLASAFLVGGIVAFWMSTDPKSVAILIGFFGLIAGGYVTFRAYEMARKYSVNSPWKPAFLLTGVSVITAGYVVLFT